MNVLTLNLGLLTQHELLGYLKRINSLMSTYPPSQDTPIGAMRISFLEAMNYFDKVLKPPTRSSYTEEIQQIRTLRLDQWSSLRSEIRGKCKSGNPSISQPAKKGSAIMDRYGDLRRITSMACDAAVDNILQDLKEELSDSELTKLNIADWITLLAQYNRDYKNKVEVRLGDKQKYGLGLTIEARKAAIRCYRETLIGLEYLSLRGSDSEKESCQTYIEKINTLIKTIKPILKSRMTRRKNEEQLPEGPKMEPQKELIEILNEEASANADL